MNEDECSSLLKRKNSIVFILHGNGDVSIDTGDKRIRFTKSSSDENLEDDKEISCYGCKINSSQEWEHLQFGSGCIWLAHEGLPSK